MSKLIVGVTGIFGSGKSTVSRLLEELGAARVDADQLAHEALWKGSEVYKKIAALFPEAVSSSLDGTSAALGRGSKDSKSPAKAFGDDRPSRDESPVEGLDRKVIAGIVFQDPQKLKVLEKIVHPYVRTRIQEEIVGAHEQVVVLEVPLLFEAGVDQFCDVTVTVSAPMAEIEKRLKEKGFSAAEMKARLSAQMSLQEKRERSTYTVENAKTLKETKAQVETLWKELKKK